MRSTFSLRAAALAAVLLSSGPALAAGGPYVVDDSEIGESGACKVEAFGAVSDAHDGNVTVAPACTFTSLPFVELGANFARVRSGGDWSTQFGPKAKASLLPLDSGLGIGVSASTMFSADESRLETGTLLFPFTINPWQPLRINFDIGAVYDRAQDRKTHAFAGVGFELGVLDKLTLIGELFGRDEGRAAQQAGVRYGAVPETVDLDLVFGRNLDGTRSDWITLGTIVKF